MTCAASEPEGQAQMRRWAGPPWRPAAVAVAAALAVVLWGGYDRHWSWTGINGSTATLWDWLHLLLLPIAVGILPLWLSHRTRVPKRHKVVGLSFLFALVVLVFAGYLIPWGWTGFLGNRLWDWLELLVLPLAVALSPLALELRDRWKRTHSLVVLTAAAAFLVVVLGGYVGDWRWTGFRGNTLWNWLQLWLLPLLIPAVVVPGLQPKAMAGVIVLESESQETSHAEATAGAAPDADRRHDRSESAAPPAEGEMR